MSTILRWQLTSPEDPERFIAELMDTLDVRYYPRNIIGSNLYDVFELFGREFATASIQTSQGYDDLSIDTVATSPISDRYTSKMYDNFGALVGINRLVSQSFGTNATFLGYRNSLTSYLQSYMLGSTDRGLSLVGYALNGVAPLVIAGSSLSHGWRLTTYSGSVVAKFDNYILVTPKFGRYGSLFYVGSTIPYTVGGPAVLSFSKLETNTVLRDEEWFYAGASVYFFFPTGSLTTDVRNLVEDTVRKVVPARVNPRVFFQNDFVYYRPTESVGSLTDVLSVSDRGYVYNTDQTAFYGDTYDTGILTLPTGSYTNLDWYYDWKVFERNKGRIEMGIRTYPSQSIPPTVPFYKYDPVPPPLLDATSATAHYIFDSFRSVTQNIALNTVAKNHLTSSVALSSFALSRREGLALRGPTGGFNYAVPAGAGQTGLDPTGSFWWELWVLGADKTVTAPNFIFRHTGSTRGWEVKFDFVPQNLVFSVKSGSVYTSLTGSISNVLAEEAEYWHRFAGSFSPTDGLYLYEDGTELTSLATSVTLPTLPTAGSGSFIITGGEGVGIDEFMLSNGFLQPLGDTTRWRTTQPHIFRFGVPSQSVLPYHQARARFFASASNEGQFHQFSIRGIDDLQLVHTVFPYSEPIIRYPLFNKTN